MATKPTTRERKESEKHYSSRKSIAKLSLCEVVAKLMEVGTARLPRIKIHNDQPEPFQEHPLTVDEEFNRRRTRYESLARHELLAIGVRRYVEQLGLAAIEKELKTRNLSTVWTDRSDTRSTKEQALVTAIILDEDK